MNSYKVTLYRNVTQKVETVVLANREQEAINIAYEQVEDSIDSGDVIRETINDVYLPSTNAAQLLRTNVLDEELD